MKLQKYYSTRDMELKIKLRIGKMKFGVGRNLFEIKKNF